VKFYDKNYLLLAREFPKITVIVPFLIRKKFRTKTGHFFRGSDYATTPLWYIWIMVDRCVSYVVVRCMWRRACMRSCRAAVVMHSRGATASVIRSRHTYARCHRTPGVGHTGDVYVTRPFRLPQERSDGLSRAYQREKYSTATTRGC
jgi:hypothetical protein